MKKIILGLLVMLIVVIGFFSFRGKPSVNGTDEERYEIVKKWELPSELDEVSGIAWIEKNRIACIQDEDGMIFIFNLSTSELENTVSFGGGGDYEGIALIKENAYVLRSDGVIFEVAGFMSEDPKVKKYVAKINRLPGINIEGLCADPANNRLLLAVKERKNVLKQKEIYSFDLNKKESEKDPLYVVDLSHPFFREVNEKMEEKFTPGEIGIDPKTGDHFILDGTRPKLLITGKDGSYKELFMLQLRDFGNPEGLTFSPEGDLYISNEAEDAPANILQVSLIR